MTFLREAYRMTFLFLPGQVWLFQTTKPPTEAMVLTVILK